MIFEIFLMFSRVEGVLPVTYGVRRNRNSSMVAVIPAVIPAVSLLHLWFCARNVYWSLSWLWSNTFSDFHRDSSKIFFCFVCYWHRVMLESWLVPLHFPLSCNKNSTHHILLNCLLKKDFWITSNLSFCYFMLDWFILCFMSQQLKRKQILIDTCWLQPVEAWINNEQGYLSLASQI